MLQHLGWIFVGIASLILLITGKILLGGMSIAQNVDARSQQKRGVFHVIVQLVRQSGGRWLQKMKKKKLGNTKMEKKFRIQRVPLEVLLNTLDTLWNEGVEFVDVEGIVSEKRDTIFFSVREEYYLPQSTYFQPDNYEHLIYMGPDGSKEK